MPEVREFIQQMHEQHGFDVAYLTRQFAGIHSNATVLRGHPAGGGTRATALLGTLPGALR